MNFEQFIDRLNQLRTKKPVWFGLEAEPNGTDSEIEEVEKHFSIILPKEYKEFVKSFGGGYFAFTNIFSVNEESDWSVISQNIEIGLISSYAFLAVSDNQAGDYYGFQVIERKCESEVYVFDHDAHQIKKTEYRNLYDYLMEVGLNPS